MTAQCQQGLSNVSAWMRGAVSERQCAQTCMHITCFKGPSNVSAWMSNAVSERQCAQTCMHITCFNVVAQKTLFTDSVQLTGLLHDPLI